MIEPKNLLIVRTDRIGDVVLSLPIARIIKKYFPDCKVTFLLKEYTKSLVEKNPFIDHILTVNEINGRILLKKNVLMLKKYNYDYCIMVYPTFIMSLTIFLSRIKNRIGTGYRWYSLFFNKRVYVHRKYAEKHELEFNLDMLNIFGIKEKVNPGNIKFDIQVNEDSVKLVRGKLKSYNIKSDKPLIIIHPGSGGSSVNLPQVKFKELLVQINEKLNADVVLTGSRSERNLCESLRISNNIINFAGIFNLRELIVLINEADILIANSTGPLHIAAALGKYVIGFYPKILVCSAKRWGPYSDKSFVFQPGILCENCNRKQCYNLNCMNSIDINKVLVQIEKILNKINGPL